MKTYNGFVIPDALPVAIEDDWLLCHNELRHSLGPLLNSIACGVRIAFALYAVAARLLWIVCTKQFMMRSRREANFYRRCSVTHTNIKGRNSSLDTAHRLLTSEQKKFRYIILHFAKLFDSSLTGSDDCISVLFWAFGLPGKDFCHI